LIAAASPFGHAIVSVNPDGSFGSDRLDPGKYNLYFTGWFDETTVAAYYPGVSEEFV
jgi:hypothetical protein